MTRWVVFVGLILVAAGVAQVNKRAEKSLSDRANAFLDSLSDGQRKQAVKSMKDDYRTNWRFVPASRDGIHLGDLSPSQLELARNLLQSALSKAGTEKVKTIEELEDVLFALENSNPGRDRKLYTLTFFGQPSRSAIWGYRYEGHHVSLNFTLKGDEIVSSTPQFFGANPAEVRFGPKAGTRALAAEQDLAFAFLHLLRPEQIRTAVTAEEAPNEIITSNARKVAIQKTAGLKYGELSPKQKDALVALLKVHSASQSAEEQTRRWKRVDLSSVVFAWMGATQPGKGHYYRIQGSKFLVEYDNTQNNANHIHTVWRDFEGDFGADLLAEHYSRQHATKPMPGKASDMDQLVP